MDTQEKLARHLVDNGASSFGSSVATYDEWLAMIKEGSSVGTFVMTSGGVMGGVEAVSRLKE